MTDTFRRLRESIGDRYEIERELGRGGMATVFLARDIKHDRQVAIKVLHPELSASIGADRFEREIKLAAKLQHPHILGLYDSGNADGLLYYVMPFVKGESLRDRLDREKMLPVEDAIRLTLEICGALQHAHDAGIVHRDIKPENILLAHDHALVADFGIARAANEAGQQKLTQTGMAVGTPVYMAPEQSTGDVVGPTADLYSLGCMLYEMLAGEPPFTGQNAMAIMAKHLMEQVPSVRVVRSVVPEEVEHAIFVALAKAPVDRPKTAKEFAELLGSPMGATATMRVMRGSAMMRGSMAMRRTTGPGGVEVMYTDELPVPVWKRPATLIASLAIVASAAMGFWALTRDRGPVTTDPNARRIAVLYFEDLSPDSSLGPVANGLTESIIRSLSRISAITTISSAGSQQVRRMTAPDSIASVLRAGYLVSGDLEPRRDRVIVNFRLRTASGARVGAPGNFEIARDSLFALQDTIASRVAELIRSEVFPEIRMQEQREATRSNAAWLALQEGAERQRLASARQSARDVDAATRLFEQADSMFAAAEAADPRWAEPIVRRAALAWARARLQGSAPATVRPWLQMGIAHADRALALERDNADALELSGTMHFYGYLIKAVVGEDAGRWLARAQGDLERATQVNANHAAAWASLSAAYYHVRGKGLSDVMVAAQRALAADEFLSNVMIVRTRLANAAYDLGQFDQADQYCADLERRYPGMDRAIRCRLYLQAVPGRERYDIARAWRLTDSLVAASPPRDSLVNRLAGGTFTAHTIAREAARLRSLDDSAGARQLADSARMVARRFYGDATVDPARDIALYSAFVSAALGDGADLYRKLREYIAVDAVRGPALAAQPGWVFRDYAGTGEWTRVVGRGP